MAQKNETKSTADTLTVDKNLTITGTITGSLSGNASSASVAEEAWKDANGGLLTAKATKVSSTTADTIFVNDGTGNLKDSGKSIKDIVNTYVCGGIEFSGTAST